MQSGLASSRFKRENITLDYRSKKFEIKFHDRQKFKMSIASLADIKSAQDTLNVHAKINASGEIQSASVWNFSDLTSVFSIVNRNQKFSLKSTNLKLNWIKPTCAELEGQMSTLEAGSRSPEALIQLTPTQAHLLVQGSQHPWSQKYQGCRNRLMPAHNFEFLLY